MKKFVNLPPPAKNRRQFLKWGAALAGSIGFSAHAMDLKCDFPPTQAVGPYFPGEAKFHKDNDLTSNSGSLNRTIGQIIYMRGKILDQNCRPVVGASVEIWQACASGKYDHSRDTNPAPLDPYFKYWGEDFSNQEGEYSFKSIKPGPYPADKNWMRAPHIHFKVSCMGYRDVVAQMYFKGEPLNDHDLYIKAIAEDQRHLVIPEFLPQPQETGALAGLFNITLHSLRLSQD